MTALIDHFQVCFVTAHDAHQHIRLVVLAKVRTQTALTVDRATRLKTEYSAAMETHISEARCGAPVIFQEVVHSI
jgi:hypothetical protein